VARACSNRTERDFRSNNPGSWYPIYLNKSDFSIHSIGNSIPEGQKESSVPVPKGTIAVLAAD